MHSPKAPDPNKTAQAQANANLQSSVQGQLLSMVNQEGPYGSLTYNQTGTRKDPISGKMLPAYTARTQLSPEQQGLLAQENQFDKMYNDIALRQTGAIGEHLAQPFKYDVGDYEKWAGDTYGKLTGDVNAQQQAAMTQKLAGQGLQPGTPAYDDAMRNLIYSQDKARNDFMLNAYDTGLNTALTERNQPLNEIGALMSGGQVQMPQFQQTPTASVQGTDIAGMIYNNYNQQMQQQNAMMGGLAGLGGAALGGWASGGFRGF